MQKLLQDAIELIEKIAEQQAMHDGFYEPKLAELQAAVADLGKFDGDPAGLFTRDCLVDRGFTRSRVEAALIGYQGDLWLDFYGPLLDRLEDALGLAYPDTGKIRSGIPE